MFSLPTAMLEMFVKHKLLLIPVHVSNKHAIVILSNPRVHGSLRDADEAILNLFSPSELQLFSIISNQVVIGSGTWFVLQKRNRCHTARTSYNFCHAFCSSWTKIDQAVHQHPKKHKSVRYPQELWPSSLVSSHSSHCCETSFWLYSCPLNMCQKNSGRLSLRRFISLLSADLLLLRQFSILSKGNGS